MADPGTRIVVYNPWRWRVALAVGIVILGMSVWQAWEFGRRDSVRDLERLLFEEQMQERRLDELLANEAALRERIAILERGAEIDATAYTQVKESLRELQDQNLNLREEVAFYRGIVSPDDARAGVRIHTLELLPSPLPGRFRYNLLLTQVMKNDRKAEGVVNFTARGTRDGWATEIGHSELVGGKPPAFSFRYFQNLDGDLELPEGFQPESIEVTLSIKGKQGNPVSRRIDWPAG